MLTKLKELVSIAKKLKPKKTAVVVADDALVIEGVALSYGMKLIIPTLIGRREKIKSALDGILNPNNNNNYLGKKIGNKFLSGKDKDKNKDRNNNLAIKHDVNEATFSKNIKISVENLLKGIEKGDVEILEAQTDYEAVATSCRLALDRNAEIIMKGHIHTDILMHGIMSKESGLKTDRLISHVFLMEIDSYKKLIMISDAAINIQPSILEKSQITQNAIDLALLLGIKTPKVAVLSAIETINPKIQSTIDAAVISKMAQRGQIRGGIVDGPLAFDNAVSKKAALEKGIKSDIAGDIDIAIVPNIESGNILFKDLEYLAGAKVAGVVLGTLVPVVLTSRADPPEARLYGIALSSILSENYASFIDYKFI